MDDNEEHYVLQGEMEAMQSDDSNGERVMKTAKPLREQDRFLPIANITKIMKKGIPANGKIAKDARECVQECVSEFISFITSEASERCHTEKRKTINGEDILCAMYSLGFDNYIEPLKLYLANYRETAKSERLETESLEEYEIAEQDGNSSQPANVASDEVAAPTEVHYPENSTVLYYKSDPYQQL